MTARSVLYMNSNQQEAAWARLMDRASRQRRKPTRPQIESALNSLLWLSEECDDGEMRDQIGVVRNALHEVLDARAGR